MRTLHDKLGNRLLKSIAIRIFPPGGKKSILRKFNAPAKRAFNDEGVDQILYDVISALELQYLEYEWRLVALAEAGRFNLVPAGKRDLAQMEHKLSSGSTLVLPQEFKDESD